MYLNPQRENNFNVRYSPVSSAASNKEDLQFAENMAKDLTVANSSSQKEHDVDDSNVANLRAPIEPPETDLDDFQNSQQTIETHTDDDFQRTDDDAKGLPSNGVSLFSRAGEGDGPTPAATDTVAKPPPVNPAKPNRGNGFFPDSMFSFGDARSEFGGLTPESIPDVNIYQHKKTVAQGMMDLALFSANANQLRYVLESSNHPYFIPGIILISISLMFQVAVGVGLLMNTRYNVKDKKEICIANKISNFTIVGIFLVTVINVFISAFGVASGGPGVIIGPRSGEDAIGEDGIGVTENMI